MEGISLAGLIGAMAGTAVAGVNYHLFIGILNRAMRERDRNQTLSAEERDGAEAKLSLVRRIVLTVDLFVFAAVGYWIGQTWWD
jgi:hypothetical protein